jgi:hypothetical protein
MKIDPGLSGANASNQNLKTQSFKGRNLQTATSSKKLIHQAKNTFSSKALSFSKTSKPVQAEKTE